MENQNEDIELIVFSRILMVRLYHYFQRRYKILTIFTLIGCLIGVFAGLRTKETYQTSIIGTSFLIPHKPLIEIINSINFLANDKSNLIKSLTLNKEEAEYFISIEADTVETIIPADSNECMLIRINIDFAKKINMEAFAKKLLNYIDSNQFIKNELLTEKQKNTALINLYSATIAELNNSTGRLESKNYNFPDGTNPKNSSLQSVSAEIVELERNRLECLHKQNKIAGFIIINQLNNVEKMKKSFLDLVINYGIIFFLTGVLVSIFLEMKRQVNLIENNQ